MNKIKSIIFAILFSGLISKITAMKKPDFVKIKKKQFFTFDAMNKTLQESTVNDDLFSIVTFKEILGEKNLKKVDDFNYYNYPKIKDFLDYIFKYNIKNKNNNDYNQNKNNYYNYYYFKNKDKNNNYESDNNKLYEYNLYIVNMPKNNLKFTENFLNDIVSKENQCIDHIDIFPGLEPYTNHISTIIIHPTYTQIEIVYLLTKYKQYIKNNNINT